MQGSVSILNVSPEAAAMIASGGRIHDGRHGGRDLCEITGRRAGKE